MAKALAWQRHWHDKGISQSEVLAWPKALASQRPLCLAKAMAVAQYWPIQRLIGLAKAVGVAKALAWPLAWQKLIGLAKANWPGKG